MDAVANLADWALPASSLSGTAAHRQGAGLIYPIFRCADGHVCMVVPLSPRQWVALREWLGEPAELMDEAWSQVAYRLSHLRTLNPYITDLLGDEKMVDVVAKTLPKMTDAGRAAALDLAAGLSERERAILARALAQ